jgi:hypothetical protein
MTTKKRKGKRAKGLAPKQNFRIDGQRLYIRRKLCNEGFLQRVDDKILAGEYKHIETSDDVEIYEINDASPMRRAVMHHLTQKDVERAIIESACKRDFQLYHDACSELATRFRSVNGEDLPTEMARTLYVDAMKYLELRIMRRGGPSPFEIQRELAAINQKKRGRTIVIPRAH